MRFLLGTYHHLCSNNNVLCLTQRAAVTLKFLLKKNQKTVDAAQLLTARTVLSEVQ